jgi:hypothetical protein
MGFFDVFRRKPPISDRDGLAQFIDEHAAFLAQKGIYEYARARAGHYAKVLMTEQGFLDAVERSRWQAYPLGLAMVGEVVGGILRPHLGEDRRAGLDALIAIALEVFDRYPAPTVLGETAWREARAELARRLDLVSLHPPKFAKDIAAPFAESYFELMPIHKKLRATEFHTLHNYLKVTLCNIHDEFSKRIDAPAVADLLRAGPL